jgi:hypothetical protein
MDSLSSIDHPVCPHDPPCTALLTDPFDTLVGNDGQRWPDHICEDTAIHSTLAWAKERLLYHTTGIELAGAETLIAHPDPGAWMTFWPLPIGWVAYQGMMQAAGWKNAGMVGKLLTPFEGSEEAALILTATLSEGTRVTLFGTVRIAAPEGRSANPDMTGFHIRGPIEDIALRADAGSYTYFDILYSVENGHYADRAEVAQFISTACQWWTKNIADRPIGRSGRHKEPWIPASSVEQVVRKYFELKRRRPTRDQVARCLYRSAKTVDRHLAEQGTTITDIVDRVAKEVGGFS